jgi:hypothetical protein
MSKGDNKVQWAPPRTYRTEKHKRGIIGERVEGAGSVDLGAILINDTAIN